MCCTSAEVFWLVAFRLWVSLVVSTHRPDDGSTNEGGQRTPSKTSRQRVTFSHVTAILPNDCEGNLPHTAVWCLAFVDPPSFLDPSSGLVPM